MIEWLTAIGPPVVLSVIFYLIINRIHKKLDEKVSGGVCKVMHTGLEKEIKEIKNKRNKQY